MTRKPLRGKLQGVEGPPWDWQCSHRARPRWASTAAAPPHAPAAMNSCVLHYDGPWKKLSLGLGLNTAQQALVQGYKVALQRSQEAMET